MRNLPAQFYILTLACIIGLNAGLAHAAISPVVKAKCGACHSFERGAAHKTGPNLFGIVGRKAGSAAGFKYSPDLEGAGFVWTADRLRLWLADPAQAFGKLTGKPGAKTRMPPQKLSNAEIDEVVAYLSALSPAMKTMSLKMMPLPTAKNGGSPKPEFSPMPETTGAAALPSAVARPATPASSASLVRNGSSEVMREAGPRPMNAPPASPPPASVQLMMAEPEVEASVAAEAASRPQPEAAVAPTPLPPATANGHEVAASPAPSAPSSSEIFAEVDRMLDDLPEGNIAFNAPTEMNLKKTATIQLILSMQKSIEELKASLEAEGEKQGAAIKVSRLMEARLTGADFQITTIGDEEQAVSFASPTEWKWDVKPKSEGPHKLHLTLSIVLDDKSRRVFRTFDKTIMVEVPPSQKVGDFVTNNWQWLWTVIVVPLAGWIWGRNRGQKAPPPANS